MNKLQQTFNFENIGRKIKNFTKWYCWVSIIISWVAAVICFFAGLSDDDVIFLTFIGIVGAIVFPLIIWVSSWAMYAFGELVERTASIDRKMNTTSEIKSDTQIKIDSERIAKLEKLRAEGFITEEEYTEALQKKIN